MILKIALDVVETIACFALITAPTLLPIFLLWMIYKEIKKRSK